MTVRELVTKWGFQVDHAPLEKVEKQLEGIKHTLEFLAAAEVIKGVVELTERFAKFAEELHVAAASAGITVEAFQKIAFAAGQSSVGAEEMSGAMARLSRHLYDARKGGEEAQKAFAQAGFTSQQINGFKTGQDVMLALADKFKYIQDPIKKQALAMELMGRGSIKMVGFLSQGSSAIKGMGVEAENLGLILSHHQVEALVKVEHALNKVWALFKVIGATIASYFAPSVETAINEFLRFYTVNKKLIESNLKSWVYDITYALGFVWGAVKFVTQGFFEFAKSHETLVRRVFELLVALGALVGAIFVLQKTLGFLKGTVDVLTGAFNPLKFAAKAALAPLLWIAGLIQTALVGIISTIGIMIAETFPLLGEAIFGFAALLEATPVGWFLTAIVAVGLAIEALWAHFVNGKDWKDTWIGQMVDKIGSLASGVKDFFGFGGGKAGVEQVSEALQTVPAIGAVPTSFGGGANQAQQNSGPQNYSVNAPITVNVPAGSDHKVVADKVKEGVKEHLDRVYRETQRSLRPGLAY